MYLKGRRLKPITRFPTQCIFVISLATALTACGGDGSNEVSTPPASSTNQVPSVTDQSYSINQATTLTVAEPGVLENSTDPENDALTAQMVSAPSHGTLTLNSDGSFDYVHDGSSSKTDSFTYLASDGKSNSEPGVVTIDINGVPVTSSACLPVGDLPSDLNDFVTDDDTLLSFSVVTPPTMGTLDLSPDGTVLSYSLNGVNQFFRGRDSFTYEVDDNNGATVTGSVNLIVGKTRIMPLGDSISKGSRPNPLPSKCENIPQDERIGYRAKLYQDLVDSGYLVDFVGNLQHGLSATPPIGDPDHQGTGGIEASEVADEILLNLETAPADIVLLHVGTNNVNNDDPNDTIADIERILDNIDDWETTESNPVTVMLSTIIDRSTESRCDPNPVYDNSKVTALNTRIIDTVANRQGTGDNIVGVDQHSAVNAATDISQDGVHPNQNGYNNMADEWLKELTDTGNSGEMVSLFEELKCPVGN